MAKQAPVPALPGQPHTASTKLQLGARGPDWGRAVSRHLSVCSVHKAGVRASLHGSANCLPIIANSLRFLCAARAVLCEGKKGFTL